MYKLSPYPNSNVVIRLSDGASIPRDPFNRDYIDYIVWSFDHQPEPADILASAVEPRDFVAEIDELKAQIAELQRKVK